MNSKVWLVMFGLFALLLIGGAGYYCLDASGKYQEALDSWDQKKGAIKGLERKVPYPSKKNQDALQAEVDGYSGAVGALFKSLNKFQKPLNTTIKNTEFQQLVKSKVEAFRKFAKEGGMNMDATDEFQLGFDSYANSLPNPESVPVLHYELEGIDLLLRTLVEAGAEQLLAFRRDPIPGESGEEGKKDMGVVQKFPVRLKFKADHDAFQKFINSIANNKDYFYILRVLKVTNEVKEGPLKPGDSAGASATPRFRNPETQEVPDLEKLGEWGYPDVKGAELAAKAKAEGFLPATEDARVLMGQEKLTVYMVVDITRFLDPEKVEKKKMEERKNKPRKGRRPSKR